MTENRTPEEQLLWDIFTGADPEPNEGGDDE